MFGPRKGTEEDGFDKQIKRILDDMDMFGPGSDEYDRLLKELKQVMKLKDKKKSKRSIDPNTVIVVASNLLGILIIVVYEEKHVITSKAYSTFVKMTSR